MDNYYIKENYKCNLDARGNAVPYEDSEENSLIFQYEVYEFTRDLILKNKLKNILDIGCGVGSKLNELIHPVCNDIVGIDTKHSIEICKQKYNFGKWYVDDIENPELKLNRKFDLIISSDVIEHLVDPDKLLSYIKKFSNKETLIILSTPERDLVRGKDSVGPSENKSHVREWNMEEFNNYIGSRDFKIQDHFLTLDVKKSFKTIISSLIKFRVHKDCQVILCKI